MGMELGDGQSYDLIVVDVTDDLVDDITELIQEHPAVCHSDAYDIAWNILNRLRGES